MTHILNALFTALLQRQSPYASVIAAILEAAGEKAQAVPLAPEPDMDEAWAEPEPFDGCTNQGQNRPSPQTVRKTPGRCNCHPHRTVPPVDTASKTPRPRTVGRRR